MDSVYSIVRYCLGNQVAVYFDSVDDFDYFIDELSSLSVSDRRMRNVVIDGQILKNAYVRYDDRKRREGYDKNFEMCVDFETDTIMYCDRVYYEHHGFDFLHYSLTDIQEDLIVESNMSMSEII